MPNSHFPDFASTGVSGKILILPHLGITGVSRKILILPGLGITGVSRKILILPDLGITGVSRITGVCFFYGRFLKNPVFSKQPKVIGSFGDPGIYIDVSIFSVFLVDFAFCVLFCWPCFHALWSHLTPLVIMLLRFSACGCFRFSDFPLLGFPLPRPCLTAGCLSTPRVVSVYRMGMCCSAVRRATEP